ncbi:sterol desaturase family protein [Alteromonas sp. KUL49]|uniref:sterol desaturase family protein n=1 Tax=Alteromonas sp. KUL49 TaxID=2480798 RepID=UPI00102F2B20|nr:sterol desaturase family protein [Alteromonas sp. KUL49]TAP36853.1 sterol desaturase family protein [Alteromonas sp. KUL49]GEA13115.1 hypothetical protein KUL49_34900 [Alteromonas sp. KUL49]
MASIESYRLLVFLGIFAVMGLLELWLPARNAPVNKRYRWTGNWLIMVSGALVARVLLPFGLVGVSMWAEANQIGLLHVIELPSWIGIVLCILALDLAIYWQHRLFHQVPLLWRIHHMHHADSHVDTTTGLRFHPIEIALSLVYKGILILLFGAPAVAVVLFEMLLNGFALFNHANIRLAPRWESMVSKVWITQHLHRIHHSQVMAESNANFGFSISIWDRIFGSFKSTASLPDERINLGQQDTPHTQENSHVIKLLTMPFRR